MGPATCTLSQMPLTVDQSEKTLFRQMANFAQRCDMVVRTSPVSDVGLLMGYLQRYKFLRTNAGVFCNSYVSSLSRAKPTVQLDLGEVFTGRDDDQAEGQQVSAANALEQSFLSAIVHY